MKSDLIWPRAILHLDMDAFYVNVHCLTHPEDKGIPLVVGGKPDERGVVSSASYAARQLGIRSAMPTATAVRLCPTLKIVPADWPRIRASSREVMGVLAQFGPIEKMSVDEAYVELTHWFEQEPGLVAEEMAMRVRTAVKTHTTLPASVGLATSKLVAKVASDYDKPEGCTVVAPGSEATFLSSLPTRAIWGIGPRTAEKLADMGIATCGQLAAADLGTLHARFGNMGADLQQRARGIDPRPVQSDPGISKSISQEWTFNNDINDPTILRRQLRKMSQSVAESLQQERLLAHTVSVKFRWADFTTFTRQKSLAVGTDDAELIYQLAETIWEQNWPVGQRMRLIGVGASNLKESTRRQLSLGI
ncbi:MAG: DNA polymerase IV [Anaerolineales bacterium]|nr:DNA polymerase IV [Anaerolineales bacterium]